MPFLRMQCTGVGAQLSIAHVSGIRFFLLPSGEVELPFWEARSASSFGLRWASKLDRLR
jgi:hypothetical protein